MLRFFRQIRQKLIEQDKVRKYVWYALGEVLLVMIGILLALQVNNWNEQRKNKASAELILAGVSADLLNDVREAQHVLNRIDRITEYANKFQKDSISNEDMGNLYQLGMEWDAFVMNKESYLTLNDNKDKIPDKYQEVTAGLNEYYTRSETSINAKQAHIEQHILDYNKYLANKNDWYIDFATGNYTTEVADYFSTSVLHKQNVALYTKLLKDVTTQLTEVRNRARFFYLILQNLLYEEVKYSPYIELPDLEIDKEKAAGLSGTYRVNNATDFEINIENVNQVYTIIFNGSPLIDVEPFILKDMPGDTLGSMVDGDVLVIKRDSGNKINGLVMIQETGASFELLRIAN